MREIGSAICFVVLALAGCNERRAVDTTTTTAATIEPVSREPESDWGAIKASALIPIEGYAEPEGARVAYEAASAPEPADRATVTPADAREETWTPDAPEPRYP
jgi:hypothetical protein